MYIKCFKSVGRVANARLDVQKGRRLGGSGQASNHRLREKKREKLSSRLRKSHEKERKVELKTQKVP